MKEALNQIHKQIDGFIRKYYVDQIIRGLIYSLSLLTLCLIGFSIISYFGAQSILLRTILFYSLIAGATIIFSIFIFKPLLALAKIGNRINKQQAARILGSHFPEVADQLNNLLDLENLNKEQSDLISASIEQKASKLKGIAFPKAINLKANLPKTKFLLPSLTIILIVVGLGKINILQEGGKSLVAHNRIYTPEAPFQTVILNEKLETESGEPFILQVKPEGNEIPERFYIHLNGTKKRLETGPNGIFLYEFKQTRKDIKFQIEGAGYFSNTHTLKVLPTPTLTELNIQITPPKHTGLKATTLTNQADIKAPEGSIINWQIRSNNSEEVKLQIGDKSVQTKQQSANTFSLSQQILSANKYKIQNINQHSTKETEHTIDLIKDQYPKAELKANTDSLNTDLLYLNIALSDDYGISKATINIETKEGIKTRELKQNNGNQQSIFEYIDLSKYQLEPGDEASIYVRVWDNDAINGAKSSKSITFTQRKASLEEIAEEISEQEESIKKELSEAEKLALELQQETEALRKQLLEKQELGWEEKQRLDNLLKKQQKLEETLRENLDKQKSTQKLEEDRNQNEEIIKKQEQLQKLMDEVLDEETQKLMEELQKMMDDLNKDKLQENLEKLKEKQESLEQELDRQLELFKRLEVEKEINEAAKKLEELAEKQEKLAKENPSDELEQQEKLNEEFDKLKEQIQETDKKNEELEQPFDLDKEKDKQEEIDSEQEQSKQNLQQNKKQDASKNQKKASDKMKEMAESMMSGMQSAQMEQQFEDMEALRQLLDNLVRLSLDQEALSRATEETNINNPKFVEYIREQDKLKEDASFIEDSLRALAKRVPEIEKVIFDELNQLNKSLDLAIDHLAERQNRPASAQQQFAMTASNNLALLLNEVLEQMQQQMANQMPGNQNCQKPGGSKPNPSTMQQLQQQLNQQMKQMQQMLEDGKQPGKKPGEKPGGQGGQAKQFAKMAAQQEAIRKQLEELLRENGEDGSGAANEIREALEQMDKTEEELLNQELKIETLKRQEEILSKLLKAENAEREKEKDKERESQTAKQTEQLRPDIYEKYQEMKKKESELLQSLPVHLRIYYQNLSKEYFKTLEHD